jgi:sarcosine oxidase
MGSSHGGSRVIRDAYYRGSLYAPLVEAARDSWHELEKRCGDGLLTPTGGLMIGPPGAAVFGDSLGDAGAPDYPYEVLSGADVASRFPAFDVPDGAVAVFEREAAVLDLDACLRASIETARSKGAHLQFEEPVLRWSVDSAGVVITTDREQYRARRLALAPGAWTASLAGGLDLPLEVERTIQFWFDPVSLDVGPKLDAPACPMWVWEYAPDEQWYGFPRSEGRIKAGVHITKGRATNADDVRREVEKEERTAMRSLIARFMPDAAGPCADASVCMYTNTPDRHFVIDRHPAHPEVAVFTGGSGHAFKFSLVLGELLADLATDGDPRFDIGPFSASRFRSS